MRAPSHTTRRPLSLPAHVAMIDRGCGDVGDRRTRGLDVVAPNTQEHTMQQIHVKRYAKSAAGFSGTIEPEDRSWILFVPTDGSVPSIWKRVESNGASDTESSYEKA